MTQVFVNLTPINSVRLNMRVCAFWAVNKYDQLITEAHPRCLDIYSYTLRVHQLDMLQNV